MEEFLKAYPQRRADLERVYNDLEALKQQLQPILRKNLIKSTITVGFETVTKVKFATGFAEATVLGIIGSCGHEYAMDTLQQMARSPYGRAVKKLSSDASAIVPEMRKFQWELSLSAGEYHGWLRMTSDVGEDDQIAMIYRRFKNTLDGIEKFQKRIDEIIAELKVTKLKIESEPPELYKENQLLVKRKGGLQTRLINTLKEKKEKEINEIVNEANKKADGSAPAALPPLALTGKADADYEAWARKYDAAAAVFEKEMPPLAKSIIEEREKIRLQLDDITAKMAEFQYFEVPKEIDPAVPLSAEQIVELHAGAKKGQEVFTRWISTVSGLRATLKSLIAAATELAVKERRFTKLIEQGEQLENERVKIQGAGSVDQKRMIIWLFSRLVPGYVNFDRTSRGPDFLSTASSLDTDLERIDKLLPDAIQISSKNEKTLAKMFEAKIKAYEAVSTQLDEYYTNMENAFSQMEGSAAAFDKLVAASGFGVKRNPPASEFYYSTSKGGMTSILSMTFDANLFERQLVDAMANGNYEAAKKIMASYENLRKESDLLNSKYTKALAHYYYYVDGVKGLNREIISDMNAASRVENAYLRAPAMDDKTYQRVQGAGVAAYAKCFETIPELPSAAFEPSSRAGKAIALYKIWERIEKERPGWSSLDKESFNKNMESIKAEMQSATKGANLDGVVGRLKAILSRIESDWSAKHKSPVTPPLAPPTMGPAGPQSPSPGIPPGTDYKQLVAEVVKKLSEAYEKKNAAAFLALVSRDFIGNRSFLEDGIRRDFDTFDGIRLSMFLNRIEKRGAEFVAETKWDKTQSVRKTGKQQ
ncbi:MAG: hypothetical protein NC938_06455 [Candidatus Omnitrophica bacterium]|nr:hypothetical protein [Candidatus Omnitrophota bacterium]MCM8791318.1 hypothetical protein [Candidatus Omnitrophota bacterium]